MVEWLLSHGIWNTISQMVPIARQLVLPWIALVTPLMRGKSVIATVPLQCNFTFKATWMHKLHPCMGICRLRKSQQAAGTHVATWVV